MVWRGITRLRERSRARTQCGPSMLDGEAVIRPTTGDPCSWECRSNALRIPGVSATVPAWLLRGTAADDNVSELAPGSGFLQAVPGAVGF